jgi:hypothetical protein
MWALFHKRIGKIGKLVAFVLTGVLLMGILCWIGYRLIERPQFIDLPIEAPSSFLPNGDWFYTDFATIVFSDGGRRYFRVRKETEVYSRARDPEHGFETWESVQAYFENRLPNNKWRIYTSEEYDPCINHLPESRFLSRGIGGYIAFRKPDTVSFAAEPTICIAIWPDSEYQGIESFHIVLVTVNPSTLTKWNSQFDLGQ